ncbi:MAG: flagella basal body P-ring formation protein FlgA [Rhodospirillaceae bacterium TMED8]|nr:flagella basal body P-ring formation protein FlgA [Magnetovibrio sp.]OUT50137.1 MAG: flagella basal body P-ring formation protein FlgA [Rhodospirillaceae bacterium TMED8]|tara:strand:- start:2369 stop:3376 length:1008 start_codon:yes stop_codon:yes gene_type:complete
MLLKKSSIFATIILGSAWLSVTDAYSGQREIFESKISADTASRVTVITSVVVDDPLIRIADLFTNSGEKADVEIAYAPEPGKRAIFDARWLYRISHAYKLGWRPLSDRVQSIVTRRSVMIDREEIEELIINSLARKGADPKSEIDLGNRLFSLHVPTGSENEVNIEEAHFNERTQRFTVIIASPSGKGGIKRTRVRGRLFDTIEVPVLSHRLLAGEVIKPEDINWVKLRTSRLRSNTIVDETKLIGHTPKRGLRAGYPVLASAVQRPLLVAKNSLVTMILRTRQMLLTAQGKALEAGGRGDVIRISNLQSNSIIEAEVIGNGRVAVRPSILLAMK